MPILHGTLQLVFLLRMQHCLSYISTDICGIGQHFSLQCVLQKLVMAVWKFSLDFAKSLQMCYSVIQPKFYITPTYTQS